MLPKVYRFPLTPPVARLAHGGQKIPPLFTQRNSYFLVKVFRNTLPHPRIGFIVSKKTAPHAVTRNRVKRQLRAVIEELLPTLKGGYDILFIIQKDAVDANREDLKATTKRFLTQKNLQQ